MGTAVSPRLFPPAPASIPMHRRHEAFLFGFLMLCVALATVWLGRVHAPASLQHWFAALDFESASDFGLLFAALFGAVLTHECGHFLAAWFLGFTLLGGSLGPLQVQTLHGQWKFFFNPKRLFTASISAVPATMAHWRLTMLIVIAAGPLSTILTAIAAANLHSSGHSTALLQSAFVQISVLIFTMGLIPNFAGASRRNDARLLLDLLLKNHGAQEMELSVILSQQVLAGVSPEDYPTSLLGRLAAWQGRPESEFVFASALFRWALSAGQTDLADAWDQHALAMAEFCDARTRSNALASSGCFDILFRGDFEAAAIKLSQVDFSGLFPRFLEHRARACQQIAVGHLHRAPAEILRAQYALPRGVVAYNLERTLLAQLHMLVLTGVAKPNIKQTSTRRFRTASV